MNTIRKWNIWTWGILVILALIINQSDLYAENFIARAIVDVIYILAGLRLLSYGLAHKWWD